LLLLPLLLPPCLLHATSTLTQVHSKSDEANKYFVALDAAAYAASHVLDLSHVTPDFVTLSFYKVCQQSLQQRAH
jgi:hypothetical protein